MSQAAVADSVRRHAPLILPDDEHNRELLNNTHPSDWVNPEPRGRYNLVVIGSGTAGLTAAGGCAAVGGRVALIERHLTGGDCLVSSRPATILAYAGQTGRFSRRPQHPKASSLGRCK